MKKSNTSKEKYQQEALSILNEYEMVAYTDGSRLGDSTGYAVVYGNQVVRERLDDYCSVFTAESRAVLKACQLLGNSDFSLIAIASVSLSTLINVMNPDTGNYLAKKLLSSCRPSKKSPWYGYQAIVVFLVMIGLILKPNRPQHKTVEMNSR
jgi:hypothetical protein